MTDLDKELLKKLTACLAAAETREFEIMYLEMINSIIDNILQRSKNEITNASCL